MKITTPKAKKVKQKLIQVQWKVLVVGVLPTSGSKGQFSVHDHVTPGRRATVVSAEKTRKSAVLRASCGFEAVGRRPARGGSATLSDLARSSRTLTIAAATGGGSTTVGLRQIDALQSALHDRGRRGLLVRA